MPTIMVSAEGASVRRRGSGKPKLVVRGRRRKAVADCIRKLTTLQNQDFAENRRAAVNDYTAYLVLGDPNSRQSKAIMTLLEALEKAMNHKV
jgi:hypothetical protein